MSKTLPILSLILVSLLVPQFVALAQAPETASDESYVHFQQALPVTNIPEPQLGWILPSGELVTELSASSISVLSENPKVVIAHEPTAIPPLKVQAFVERQKVDCDQLGEETPAPLFQYKTGLPAQKRATQVLVLEGSQAKVRAAGLAGYSPSADEEAAVWTALKADPKGRHNLRAIMVAGRPDFYVFAATYNRRGVILRSGIFLEDHSGRILGREIEDIQGLEQCDGCAVLTQKDGIDAIYDVENLLLFPGVAYPVLLINSSTVEGRATELFAFSLTGEPCRFRLYEYMVTCILGSADEQAKPVVR